MTGDGADRNGMAFASASALVEHGNMLAAPEVVPSLHDDDIGSLPGLSARTGDESPFQVVVRLFDHPAVALHYVTGGGPFEPDSEAGILLNSIQDAMSIGAIGRWLEDERVPRRFVLSGRIRCSECGDNYWGRATHSKGNIYLYYGHPYNECENRNHIRVDDLDSNIKSVIWEWSYGENSSWDDIMDIQSATDQIVEDQPDKVRADRAKLAGKVAQARAELLDGLFDHDSHISADDVRDYFEKLEREDQALASKDDKLVTELKTDYIDLVVQQQDDLETMKVFDTLGADFCRQKEDEKNRRAESARYHMLDDEANRINPEFYTPEEWVELVQLFDVQVRVDRDRALITCLAGERHLSVKRRKVRRNRWERSTPSTRVGRPSRPL